MNWSALSEALDITTEMRPVYRAGTRAEHANIDGSLAESLRSHSCQVGSYD